MSRIVNWLLGYDLGVVIDSIWECLNDQKNDFYKKTRNIEGIVHDIPHVREKLFCNDCANMGVRKSNFWLLSNGYTLFAEYTCMDMSELSKDNPLNLPMRHDKCPGYKKPAKKGDK